MLSEKVELKFGIPGSLLKGVLSGKEIPCTSEAEAMAIAVGTWFAGKEPIVYMQNSGLMHIADIVLSLYKPYEIPLPKLLLSIRYKPKHHKLVGDKTKDFLKLIEYDENKIETVEKRD